MRVVTTCSGHGFREYGHRVLEGWRLWPRTAELRWYTEGYSIPETPGVEAVPLEHNQSLQNFKRKFGRYVPPGYLWDIVKFSHKVFAAIDGLSDYDGIGVWLDADCVTTKTIPDGMIEGLLERDAYIGVFQRAGLYTETGLWVVNCAHPQHRAFMSMWQEWYESGGFKTLQGWTDCHTLDATIRKFSKAGLIKVTNLSGEYGNDPHPMAKVPLAEYLDHCKGRRKIAGISPENQYRTAA